MRSICLLPWPQPQHTLFLDDSLRNVGAASALGIHTVLIGKSIPVPGAEVVAPDMHGLPDIWPELFVRSEAEGGQQGVAHAEAQPREVAVQAS